MSWKKDWFNVHTAVTSYKPTDLNNFVTSLGVEYIDCFTGNTKGSELFLWRIKNKLLSCVPGEAVLECLNKQVSVCSVTDLVLISLLSAPVCISWLWMKAAEQ